MEWTDSDPLEILYVAGATGWGSDGYWEVLGCGVPGEGPDPNVDPDTP